MRIGSELPDSDLDLDVVYDRLSNEVSLQFGQPWLPPADRDFAPGAVKIGRRGESLVVFADLVDESVGKESFAFNFPAFTQSDAFEIFLHATGSNVYYEFHVTPSNSVMQLKFPVARAAGLPLTEHLVTGLLFCSRTRIQSPGWQVAAIIPLSPLCEPAPIPQKWACSFGRYDYTQGKREPVISSTSLHTVCNFHRLAEWTSVNLRELPVVEF